MNVSALVTPATRQAIIKPRQPSGKNSWMARPNKVSLAWASSSLPGACPAMIRGKAATAINPVKAQAMVKSRLMKLP